MKFLKSVAILLFLLYFSNSAFAETKVFSVTGDVRIDGKKADKDQIIANDFEIFTGPESSCEIIFGGQNIVKIFENSQMKLTLNQEEKKVNMIRGAIASVLRQLSDLLPKEKFGYSIQTPTTIAGVRGTVFFMKVEENGSTYICDCNGKLELSSPETNKWESVEAYNHKGFRYSKSDGRYTSAGAGMLYHDNKMMNELADKIGVKIDWKKTPDSESAEKDYEQSK